MNELKISNSMKQPKGCTSFLNLIETQIGIKYGLSPSALALLPTSYNLVTNTYFLGWNKGWDFNWSGREIQ